MSVQIPSAGKGITVDVLGLLGLVSLAYFIISGLHSYYRLREFRGPWLAVTSRLWILKCVYYKNMHWELKKVCEKYGTRESGGSTEQQVLEGRSLTIWCFDNAGSVARIGPNDLVTDDPELLIKMSAVRSPYSKSETYSGTQFDLELNHVFSERDEKRHLDLRRRLTPGVRRPLSKPGSVDAELFVNTVLRKGESAPRRKRRQPHPGPHAIDRQTTSFLRRRHKTNGLCSGCAVLYP